MYIIYFCCHAVLTQIFVYAGDINVEEDVCMQCMCSYQSNYEVVDVECQPIVCPTCPGKIVEDGSCCGFCDLSVCVVDGIEYDDGNNLINRLLEDKIST